MTELGEPAFDLRPAETEDRALAWTIERAAFAPAVERAFGGWTELQVAKMKAAWSPVHTRMVLSAGSAVGLCRVRHRADHDWIDLIALLPEVSGRGLGGAVLKRLQAEAVRRGVPVWLSVHRDNPACRLYVRLGFAPRPRDAQRLFMVFPSATPGSGPLGATWGASDLEDGA